MNNKTMIFSKTDPAGRGYSILAFRVATLILLLIGIHSYIVSSYNGDTSKWGEQFLNAATGWYVWAGLFPFIFWLARRHQFDRKLKSALVHILAGVTLALVHAILQTLFYDLLLYPERIGTDLADLFKGNFVSTLFWRFFVYLTLLSASIALNSYRRARETELQVSQMEAGILQSQIESVRMQLDPDFVFKNLDQLSTTMKRDPDEAESMIAELGNYLRRRLDHANSDISDEEKIQLVIQQKKNDSSDADLDPSDPVRKWLVIIAVFTAIAIYFTIQRMAIHAIQGTTMNWPQHLLDYSGWYIWALLTPFVLKVSAKYPLQRKGWAGLVVIHFIALAISWLAATVAHSAVQWAANLGEYGFFANLPAFVARSPFSLDIVCYSTILAIESALRYHRRYKSGRIRTIKLTSQLARARLQALEMQIHPHFLFNALNSLSELMQEDLAAAEEMIRNLKMFLRLTVNPNHAQEIPFEQELEFLKCYLAIENVRYQDRLDVKMEIEPQALSVSVPNLMLQPIVENAIRHGIAPRSTPGLIDIQAKRNNGMLQISIRDNGPGISKLKKKTSPVRSGLGLSNTRERLSQLYGDGHRFELINVPEGGLLVTLEIPVSHRRDREER